MIPETNVPNGGQHTPLSSAKESGRRLLVETGRAPDGWEPERWRHFETGCLDGTITLRQLAAGLVRLTPAACERVLEPLRALTAPRGEVGTVAQAVADLLQFDALFVGSALLSDLEETEDMLGERRQLEAALLAALRQAQEDTPTAPVSM